MGQAATFVQIVADGRHMSADSVRTLADGRVFTGRQALALGLVDAVVYEARAHPQSVRTVDYWVFYWDDHWSSGPLEAYPSFQEWRCAADDFVIGAAGERATAV
jgi:ClpP class serine protease